MPKTLIPEIDAGGLLRALATRLPTVELTDNVHQRDEWERNVLARLREGQAGQAIEA